VNASQLNIRRAGADDADAIAGLVTQLGYPTQTEEVPGRLDRMTLDDRATVLLAELGDRVVGLATVHILSVVHRDSDVAWLTALVVDSEARGSGVGRKLVEAAEQVARQAGCVRLSVTTHEQRFDAQAFYLAIGLEQTGRRYGKDLT
jgi:GNAT superfamily N-acetyltransferase